MDSQLFYKREMAQLVKTCFLRSFKALGYQLEENTVNIEQ
jgi:hypothetical protein